VAARDAEHRVHEAELRAARAEARAEAVATQTHATGAATPGHVTTSNTYVDTDGDGVADSRLTGRRRWLDW